MVSIVQSSESIKYIGISKLSCFLCDEILNYQNIDHRGTHGELYLNGFQIPEFLDAILGQLLLDKAKQHMQQNWEATGVRVFNNERISKSSRSQAADVSDDEDFL